MTPHWSASSRTVTSLLTDMRLRSWLSGAVLTTWSLTRSKLWRWPWRFLGITISRHQKWDIHIDSIVKKAQQRLYFLHQLRKFNLPQELLIQFYSAIIESILCTSITVWFSSATKSDLRKLRRVIRTAERIIDKTLPTLQELYSSRVSKRTGKITLDPSHPAFHFIYLFIFKYWVNFFFLAELLRTGCALVLYQQGFTNSY